MPANEPFPWDLLKAECLRLVCSQLVQGSKEGGNYPGLGRKEEMIHFLRDVETLGLEPAIQKIDTTPAPRKASAGSDNQEEGTKRKGSAGDAEEEEEEEEEEGDSSHNTRYKGAKRVKLTKDDQEPSASASATPRKSGPGRPRKSTEAVSADGVKRGRGRPRKSDATTVKQSSAKDEEAAPESSSAKKPKAAARPKAPPPTDENGVPIKRGRGRPRKNVDAAPAEASPSSKGKTVFDGVILNKRRASVDETSGDAQQPAGAEQSGTAGQDDAAEEDVVLAVINGQGAVAVSSQGDSNQGNSDSNKMNVDEDHDADADADADGDPDPQVITA